MQDKNKLIDLLVKGCNDKGLLLYDSNLLSILRELSSETIINYLKEEFINGKEN